MKRFLFAGLLVFSLMPLGWAAPKAPAKKPASKPAAKPKPKPTPRPASTRENPLAEQPTPEPEPEAKGPKTWALLVGVSHYESSQIASLNFPATDATGIRDALVDRNVGGLPANQVLLLTNAEATRDKIMGAVSSFLKPNVKEGDKVIVFLAGHGVAKGSGPTARSYFLPTDVSGLTTQAFDNSAVPLRTLTDTVGDLPASQFVIFVDACREDPTPGRGIKENGLTDVLSRSVMVVPANEKAESATFFACSVGQRAYEDKSYGHGVFTNWILQGIRKGGLAQKSDGAVDMGSLSSFVTEKVGDWAKDASASGDFDYAQNPQLVTATDIKQKMILLNVKKPTGESSFTPVPPRLLIAANPPSAQVSIDGNKAGVGTIEKILSSPGEHTITVSAPGYAPVARSVSAQDGFEHQVVVQLQPNGSSGATAPAPTGDDPATGFYNRAIEAEGRQQWEVADQGYQAAIGANPKFTAAYESLIELHRLQNRNSDTIADALGMVANAGSGAHSLSLLSRAYSSFATNDAGTNNTKSSAPKVKGYDLPKKPGDAVKMAQKAAKDALAADANSSEANLAQGYALAALDTKGKNKSDALGAFGKAVVVDPQNAANQLGVGYGIRYYAVQQTDEGSKTSELNRAVISLKEAVHLRPTYYEGHRELAYTYIALNKTDEALAECQLANANRGAAPDVNQVATVDVAMAGLHQKIADNSTGDKKTENEAAAKGYTDDSKDTATDLKLVGSILDSAGISTNLASYLPPEVRQLLDIKNVFKGKINETTNNVTDKIRNKIKIPRL